MSRSRGSLEPIVSSLSSLTRALALVLAIFALVVGAPGTAWAVPAPQLAEISERAEEVEIAERELASRPTVGRHAPPERPQQTGHLVRFPSQPRFGLPGPTLRTYGQDAPISRPLRF